MLQRIKLLGRLEIPRGQVAERLLALLLLRGARGAGRQHAIPAGGAAPTCCAAAAAASLVCLAGAASATQ